MGEGKKLAAAELPVVKPEDERASLCAALAELHAITETLISGGYDCTDRGEPWTDFGIVCGIAERLAQALLNERLLEVYKPEGVVIWLADAERKGLTLAEQFERVEQLIVGAFA